MKLTLEKDWLLWLIFLVNAGITGWKETEIVWVFLASGVLALLVKAFSTKPPVAGAALLAIPPWWVEGLHGPVTGKTLWTITWFFTKAGAFVFGSGLAIVPFLYGGVVQQYGWLTERQFLDAVAVAMITPGPVVITVAFVGYLTGGPAGGCLAALGTFLPCYLFVITPAPFFRKFAKNRHIKAFVDGVTAAATGAIGGAAFVLAKRAIIDVLRDTKTTDRDEVSLRPETTEAIDQYLAALDTRLPGAPPGRRDPVFVSLSKRSFGKRLSPSAILEVVKKRAREAGIRRNIVAHSLRHAAVTHALDHHASLEETGAHARHRDPRTTARYDRRRKRRGAAAADALPHLAV